MARSDRTRPHARWGGLSVLLICAAATSAAPVRADLTGKWRFDFGPQFTDVTQTGNSVSFVLTVQNVAFLFNGTLSGSDLRATVSVPSCAPLITAVVSPDESSFNGTLSNTGSPCTMPASTPITGQRCGCFDGNSNDGDGCDARCQVEVCYTCSGDPSVCTPAFDGSSCDDGSPCTANETCTGGTCGGGQPVTPPCVDLSGAWLLHYSFTDFQYEFDSQAVFRQTNTQLEVGGLAGPIDPISGAFQLVETNPQECAPDRFIGQAAADSRTLTGVFTEHVMTPTMCPGFDAQVTGTRCGGGTLDSGEECDDGNAAAGDGCDANCRVERCYGCIGSPSVCSPLPDGTTCDDQQDCTVGDACHSGACTGSAQPDGSACSDHDVCTLGDACASGVCTGTPLDCGLCGACAGTSPTCILQPDGFACDDGDGCTVGDTCHAGACTAGGPMFCDPCFSCVGNGQCVVAPRTGCLRSRLPSRTTLLLRNTSGSDNDAVTWKWQRGQAITLAALGDPTQQNPYALCIYDETAAAPVLLFSAVAQNVSCPDLACWTARPKGFLYHSANGDGHGLTEIDLRARRDGRARALVKGKGPFLMLNGLPTPPLPLPLRVQLHAINSPTCFEAEYGSAGVSTNSDGVFKARATGP